MYVLQESFILQRKHDEHDGSFAKPLQNRVQRGAKENRSARERKSGYKFWSNTNQRTIEHSFELTSPISKNSAKWKTLTNSICYCIDHKGHAPINTINDSGCIMIHAKQLIKNKQYSSQLPVLSKLAHKYLCIPEGFQCCWSCYQFQTILFTSRTCKHASVFGSKLEVIITENIHD